MHLGVLTMFVGTGACILVHGSQHVIYHGVLIVDWQAIYIMPVMYISSDVIVMYIVVCGIQCLSAPAHASRHANYYGIRSLSTGTGSLGMCSISACWLLIGKPCNIMPVIYFSSGVIVMYVYCSIADG